MSYDTVWICGGCGYGGHLAFGNKAFSPTVCRKCGSSDTANREIARLRYRPTWRHPWRFQLVTRDGEVVGWG